MVSIVSIRQIRSNLQESGIRLRSDLHYSSYYSVKL